MSSDGYDLISIGYEANYLSSQWIVDVNNISSNIYYQDYKTNPYLSYKFANKSGFLNDSSGNQKHIINYGGTYVSDNSFDSLLLSSNTYAIIPNDDWNACKNLTVSTWFKTIDAQNANTFFNNTTNLEVWYKFDGSLNDSSGKSRNLTNNGAIFESNNYMTGNGSLAINYTANEQYVTIPSFNPFTIWNTNGMSISFWIKAISTGQNGRIFDFNNASSTSTNPSVSITMYISTAGVLYGYILNNVQTIAQFTLSGNYLNSAFYHISWTINYSSNTGASATGATSVIYVNGVNQNISYDRYIPSGVTWNYSWIGRSAWTSAGDGFIKGNIDDFRIYNRVLSSAEVDALYRVPQNSLKLLEFGDTFYDDNTNLLAWYKFDTNDILTDSSGNGYHLVNNNNAIFDNFNYRFGNGSVYLNGSSQYLDMPASINPYIIWNNGIGITFTTWFKMSTTSGTFARIIDFGDNAVGTNPSNWVMLSRVGTGTTLRFSIGLNGESTFTTTASYVDNQWHHVAWSISSSGIWSIWIDSILQILSGTGATGTLTGTYPKMLPNATWTKRWICRSSFSADGWYIGNIDDFRIYNKVLTNFEVNTLFTMGDNIVLKKESNKISFQVNNTPIYETPYVDNTWNHIIWNITNSSSSQGYVELNNGVKNNFNQIPLAPESRQFPPYPMTDFENTFFGYTYRACALSWYTPEALTPWKLFDRSTTRYVDSGSYTAAGLLNITGASFGSDTNYKGVYFGIDMGQPFIIDYYRIELNAANRRPKYWKIYATNNDACWNATGGTSSTPCFNTGPEYDWVQIDVRYNETQYTNATNFYVNKTIPYRYYSVNVNSVNSDTYIDIQGLMIFGYNPMQIIQQYPPAAMTGFDTTYAGITYRACAYNYSTVALSAPWNAFDRSSAANANRYVGADSFDINGVLNISGVSFGNDTAYKGVYLGIDMGQPFIMKYYHILQYLYTRNPRNWKIYATNDSRCWNTTGGSFNTPSFNTDAIYNWTQIDVRSQEISYTNLTRFTLDSNNTPYRYYAFHVNALIGGTASGGYNFDIYEWQIFGYPYYSFKNRLGSMKNLGNVYFSDFNIHTTPLIAYDEDKLYGMLDLINNNNVYTPDYKNSIILRPGDIIPLTTTSWNTSNDLTVSGWFKTEGIQNGDVLFESIENDIVTITSNVNNHVVPNNLTTVSFNYTSNITISQGIANISFNTPGAIVVGGITDRSYPLLTTYSTSNTVTPLAIYAGNNINIIEPYMWYKFNSGELTLNSGTSRIDLTAVGSGGTINTTTFVKGDASVYFANSTTNYFRTSTPITNNVPLSIAFWFRIPAGNQNTYTTMVSYTKSPYAVANLAIQIDYQGSTAPANKLRAYTALDTQWNTQPTSTTSIAMDTWYHVVYTLDDSNPVNARLYINGVLESTVTGSANKVLANVGNIVIGASGDIPSARGFIGFIDDFRFYTFALNISQVTELYRGRAIFYNSRSMRLWRNNNLLEFQANGSAVTTSAITLNNTWNHIIWNIASSANTQGFVRINNGSKANVPEFVTNMPLQRYPPTGMTSPSTNFSSDIHGYNGGLYILSASSEYSPVEAPWKAFNYNNSSSDNTNIWTTSVGLYSATNGSYLGSVSTIISGTSILGEWLQIQLPLSIILSNYSIYTHATNLPRGPKEFRIAGSNDGIIWTLVDSQTNITSYTSVGKSFALSNNQNAYMYYRFVFMSNNIAAWISLQELEINGFPLYPFRNTLGSIMNKGKVFVSNFSIITNAMTTLIENSLYATAPDDGSTKDTKIIYENMHITSNEIKVYNTDYIPTYPYLQYEFQNADTLSVDSSSNLRLLNNDGGTNLIDYGKNSLFLRNGDEAWFDSEDWNKNSNLTISTWFKTDAFKTGDEIIDFYQDPSTYIQVEQYVKYPKEAMTSDTFTSSSTGIVTRTKSTSYWSISVYPVWRLFNYVRVSDTTEDNNGYHSSGSFTTSTGIATTTYFPGYAGEGPLIDLGVNIVLKQIRFYPRLNLFERCPGVFRIYATNDITKFDNLNYLGWDLIHEQTRSNMLTTVSYIHAQPTIVNINNNNSYRIYALVVNTLSGTGGNAYVLNFYEWELYGNEVTLTTPPMLPVQILGGDYYYAFTNTNMVYDLNVLQDTICDILVVGGGAGGQTRHGPGGGAGACLYLQSQSLLSGIYSISIGEGGLAQYSGQVNGVDTFIIRNNQDVYRAKGGGVGNFSGIGYSGGSSGGGGGGAYGSSAVLLSNVPYGAYGNIGGSGIVWVGGGGGGAGSAGGNAISSPYGGGFGGSGRLIDITGIPQFYAAGGGGSGGEGGIAAKGGSGIGGDGAANLATAGSGKNGTGSGGGGSGYTAAGNGTAGNGGSGIVIIRFHSGLKIAENSSNQLSLYVNNKSVYDTGNILDNQWNHLMWNVINNGTPYGYVKLNNSQKIMTNTSASTLSRYPKSPATANTYICSDGIFVRLSGSSVWTNSDDHNYYRSLNYNTSDFGWGSGAGTYVIASGLAVNTYRYDYAGEYLQIDLGETIILKNYNIYTRASFAVRGPKDFRLYASNDANCWTNINHVSWVQIDAQVNLSAYTDFVAKSFTINNNNPYRFYVLITNKIFTTDGLGLVQIAELELYGLAAKMYSTLNPVISYTFNETPDIFNSTPLLYDSNSTNSTKFNMTVNSFFNDTTNLIAWYRFDDNNITADYSGNNMTLTNGGGMVYNGTLFVRGNGSVYSSAITSTFYLDSTAITLNTSFSISVWINPTNLGSPDKYLLTFGTSNTQNNLLQIIFMISGSNIIVRYSFYSNDIDSPAIPASSLLNTWTHLTFTYDISTKNRSIFINGINVATGTNALANPTFANRFILGKTPYSGASGFIGYIDDVRIYNRVITANEISMLVSTSTNFFNDTRNLATWYKFDGSSTNMLLDSSANSYNLINSGAATYDSVNYKVGNGSIKFLKASSQYVSNPNFNFYTIWYNNGISFSIWVYPFTTQVAYGRIFQYSNSGTNYFSFEKNASTSDAIWQVNIVNNGTQVTKQITLIINSWNHVVWSISAQSVWKIYLNGVDTANTATLGIFNLTGIFYIGSGNGASTFLDGNIDDFRIYNRILSQDEVTILYNGPNFAAVSTVNSTTTNLVVWYKFDDNNITADSSGNNYTATNTNAVYNSTYTKRGNGSLSFNSAGYLAISQSIFNNLTNGTVSVWVYLNSVGTYVITSKQWNGNNTYALLSIGCYSATSGGSYTAGTPGIVYWHSKNSVVNAQSVTALAANTWYHIIVTISSTQCLIYINGVLESTTSGDFSIPNQLSVTNSFIGYWFADSIQRGSFINGYIDDVRVYNKVLTAAEVSILYRDNPLTLTKTTGYTTNNYLYQNAYLWNGSTALTTDNAYLSFNGHVSYIKSLLNLFHSTNGFSIHFVFRTSNITSTSQILYIGNNTTDLIRVFITNTTFTFKVGFATQTTCTILANTTYIVDLTALWSVAKDSMILKIFINSLNVATASGQYNNSFLDVNTTGLSYYFGKAASDSTNDATPVWIQDFRMFHYPLSDAEIAALQTGAIGYNNDGLYPGYYINKLGSIANLGDLYLSDFRIITEQMTTALEDIIYNNKPEYYSIVDEDTITDTIKNMNALYFNGSKKLETNATGINVKGNISATGEVLSFYSDERLKTVVSGIDNPVEKLMKINAFKYVPNELARTLGIETKDVVEIGVSAQDVQDVLPEIVSLAACDREILDNGETVSKSGENYLTVSYQRMIPLLIECIKELSDEIESIEQT